MKLIPSKVGGISLQTLAIAGAVKYFTEKLSAPYIGNGTLMSGAIKLGASQVLKSQKEVSLALGIDGVEDIMQAVFSGNMFGALSGQDSNNGRVVY